MGVLEVLSYRETFLGDLVIFVYSQVHLGRGLDILADHYRI